MMLKIALAAATAAVLTASPAFAATYDAFTSFTGTAQFSGNTFTGSNGPFIYGEADPAAPAVSGTFFAATTNCFIDNSVCLQRAANHDVPGFTKSSATSFQYGTVNVPNDRLLAHPGNDNDLTYLAFVAPTAGTYRLNASFNVQDINPTGVDISRIDTTAGGLPLIFTPIGSIGAGSATFTYTALVDLGASQAVGFGLGNGGLYYDDSTGVNFTVTSVPEPASWAMMIGGFGLVGGAMRRRATGARLAHA